MGDQKLIQIYPPDNWICPGCGKSHKKPHYAHEGQIDFDKKPGEAGRVLFNRRKRGDGLDTSMEVREGLPAEAPDVDENGNPRALACPHCGFVAEIEVLVRTGEVPSLPERFFKEMDREKIPASWRNLVDRFFKFLKEVGKL